jgi:hypothetical protein
VTSDGIVLLNVENGAIMSANLVAARIWERLLSGDSEASIVDGLASECQVAREIVETDVREFVESLRAQALITDAPGA